MHKSIKQITMEIGSLLNHMEDAKAFFHVEDLDKPTLDQYKEAYAALYQSHVGYTERLGEIKKDLKRQL
jgi:hypothetical protein